MSPERQPAGAAIVWSLRLDGPRSFDEHVHSEHQLAWAAKGVLTMGSRERSWVLSSAHAMWIPSGVAHFLRVSPGSQVHSLYLDPETSRQSFVEPTPLDASPLLIHLIEYLTSAPDPGPKTRAEQVLFDLLEPVAVTAVEIPEPDDARVIEVARALREDPGDQRTLSEFGRAFDASGRTLARAIERDTGMTFGRYRTQIRILAALSLLAEGQTVTQVARSVGYATPSAFVAAFRRTTGTTPGAFKR